MNNIDKYLAKITEPQKNVLISIRILVKTKFPTVTEAISYGMPVFKYKGKYLIGYAAFKDHMSLFPGAKPIEILKDKLAEYKTSKGTIQFTVDRAIPDELILEIIKIRVSSINQLI